MLTFLRPFAIILLCTVTVAAPGQTGARTAEPSELYQREWLLCGPFPTLTETQPDPDTLRLPGMYTDYLQSCGGETNARPVAGQALPFPGGTCLWKPYLAPGQSVDLNTALAKTDRGVAYAYCTVDSPQALTCALALGSNDGARAWLNGEPVLDCPGPRGLQLDQNVLPVALRAGTNHLLLKIEQRGNRWEFACRFLPLSHPLLDQRLQLFEVLTREDGTPVIRPRQSPAITAALLRSAQFEAVSAAPPHAVLWTRQWTPAAELPIGVETRSFSQNLLRVKTVLNAGGQQDLTFPFAAGRRIEYALFEQGRSPYRIVLGTAASDSEQWAAHELQHWLQEVGGASLPIQSEAATADNDHVIVVGWNDRARKILRADSPPKDADESFTYRSLGPAILIYGGKQRGTLYGVMSFLERELGVRFYTPKVTVAPKKTHYTFTGLNHSEKPGVRVRNDFYFEAFDPIWAAHNRVNGAMDSRQQPGGLESYWAVHTFYPLMPPEEFFQDHPEYYSLIDGHRTADRAQLCLVNPQVLSIMTERIKQKMRELPQYLIYDVSQNDWSNPCQCPDCQAVVDREGSQSGPIIQFVNQVADNVKAEFPDKFIGTLAYSYTRKPPKTLKPRDNVVVRFCSIECCFAHDFLTCPENKPFVDDMKGWAAIAPHIYIWDYVVNFSHYTMPYPNFRVLQPNIQFFRDHHAIGIMEQAAYQSRGGEFAELRAYLIAKLLWNPDTEVEPILNDFMSGYYGRAGQYIRAYFDLLHGQLTPDTHIHLGLPHDDKLFSDAFVRQAEALFDQAEVVADNEQLRQRVELARLPIMYLKCKRVPAIARQDGTYARFCAIAKRENVTLYAEAGEPHKKAFHTEVEMAH